jgi:hypothetical protein
MAETAAHLVDHVFPEVPVRQWVLCVPFALRYRLAHDSSLVRDVLQIFSSAHSTCQTGCGKGTVLMR